MENNKPYIATKFDLNRCYEIDFEMGHFYSHKHPNAVFVNNLVLSRIEDNIIYSLVNSKYLKIYKDKTQEIKITSSTHLDEILKDDFNSNCTSKEAETLYNKFVK